MSDHQQERDVWWTWWHVKAMRCNATSLTSILENQAPANESISRIAEAPSSRGVLVGHPDVVNGALLVGCVH